MIPENVIFISHLQFSLSFYSRYWYTSFSLQNDIIDCSTSRLLPAVSYSKNRFKKICRLATLNC